MKCHQGITEMSITYLSTNSQNRRGIPVCVFIKSRSVFPSRTLDLLIEIFRRLGLRNPSIVLS